MAQTSCFLPNAPFPRPSNTFSAKDLQDGGRSSNMGSKLQPWEINVACINQNITKLKCPEPVLEASHVDTKSNSLQDYIPVFKEKHGKFCVPRRLILAMPFAALISPAIAVPALPGFGSSVLRSLGLGDSDIYYPQAFEGTWDCGSTLRAVDTPQGEDKADSRSLELSRKQLGYTMTYQARFIPYKGKVIGDRLYTTASLLKATVGKDLLENAIWDPEHPNRLILVLRGGTKVENLVTKRYSEMVGPGQFDTSEYSKQVLGSTNKDGLPLIKASRNLTRYKWDPLKTEVSMIEAVQRVTMFQVPQENLENFDIFNMNKPITVYKYSMIFRRVPKSL